MDSEEAAAASGVEVESAPWLESAFGLRIAFFRHRRSPAHGGERTCQTPPSVIERAILSGFLTSGPVILPAASHKFGR